jgi:hypothetical protein
MPAGRSRSRSTLPAYVRDTELNILAANDLCVARYGDVLTPDRLPLNPRQKRQHHHLEQRQHAAGAETCDCHRCGKRHWSGTRTALGP